MSPELPPKVGLSIIKRALVASVAIVLMTAGAVSAAAFLQVDDIVKEFEKEDGRVVIEAPEIDRAEAGEARTIMVVGSDARYGSDKRDRRSDTIILARLDPDKDAITVMSIPRDLKVTIPGYAYPDKINAAFSNGGARLTLKAVKQLLSTPDRPFEVNHLVQIDFGGFRRAVDYFGCVYLDIDRDYFNDRGGPGGYATIDVDPGYQKLCGLKALDYVRYRHTDNDLVRAARQQDFIRQLKNQAKVKEKLNPNDLKELARLVGRYTDSDRSLRHRKTLFSLLKLGIFTAGKPIQEVQFGAGRLQEDGPYLIASEGAIRKTADNFLEARVSRKPKAKLEATRAERKFARKARRGKRNRPSAVPGLEVAKTEGENQAIVAARRIDFPFYYPTLRPVGARYVGTEPRTYRITDELGSKHDAYRVVVSLGVAGEYYGIQGMTWRKPPILDGPHETRRVAGRKLDVYYDGRRVRLVAWRTKRGVYYVHNTLVRTLSERKMLAIAASLRRLGEK